MNDVDFRWVRMPGAYRSLLRSDEDTFPIPVIPPGGQIRVSLFVALNQTLPKELVVSWKDDLGKESEQTWPVSW